MGEGEGLGAHGPSGEGEDGRDSIDLRPIAPEDLEFLKLMLHEASNRPGAPWPPFEESMRRPANLRHWVGWGRAGDIGYVAQRSDQLIGAAWIRFFTKAESGQVFSPGVPVLAVAVDEQCRGQGVGRALMERLLVKAAEEGIRAIDLTTGSFNIAATSLYETLGFKVRDQIGETLVMRLMLD